ncbi:MAG TPA: hypothetical protein VGF28_02235 [Thermoanaerobaculia bacterium]|jgi:hypothetical protein
MRLTTICSLLVLSLATLPVIAGPPMYSSQKTGDISFADCAARTAKALQANGFSVQVTHQRTWYGETRESTAVVMCYDLTGTRGVVTVTAAGPTVKDALDLVNRLEAEIWGETSSAGGCGNLAGRWTGDFRGGGPTLIEQEGAALFLTNESGQRVAATCSAGVIHAPAWNNLSGDLRDNGTAIAWRNGTTWRRAAVTAPPPPRSTFAGTWQRGGGAPRIEAAGTDFTCVNEHGGSSRCVLVAENRIKAVDWEGGLIGVLSDDGKRIDWGNGTSWTR